MKNLLEKKYFVLQTCKVDNDVCATIPTSGLFEEEIDVKDYKTMISFLENTIKHREFLNKFINEENDRILGKPKQIGIDLKTLGK